jgi:hypothetical protein
VPDTTRQNSHGKLLQEIIAKETNITKTKMIKRIEIDMKDNIHIDEEATRANMKIQEDFYKDKDSIQEEVVPSYAYNNAPAIRISGDDE